MSRSPAGLGRAERAGGLQSRGLVHFSAERLDVMVWALPENMYLTPSALTLQFSWRNERLGGDWGKSDRQAAGCGRTGLTQRR